MENLTNQKKVLSWRWRRVKAGLSLKDMAKLSGKTIPQLSNYETGKVDPQGATIDIIENILHKYDV